MAESNLRLGLAGLVFGGALLNGCANMSLQQRRGLALSLAGGTISAAGAHKGDLGAVAYGQAIANHGAVMANQNNTEQNVYVKPQNQMREAGTYLQTNGSNANHIYNTSAGKLTFFVCKKFVDVNNDGVIAPIETFEEGKNFSEDEEVCVYSKLDKKIEVILPGESPAKYSYVLVNANTGAIIKRHEGSTDLIHTHFLYPGNYRGFISSTRHGILASLDFTVNSKSFSEK